ncbi:hypothetical protein [Mucilaginibacter pocheonensis]|uniref:Glycosyl transferase n=1 Tax=Mucilaginibacter pocheonensis TaxID=398050 RepID=A0ABU1T4W3_9SPHI|nr:hypothetical protein [Mucilaginibacter pocheonensis]MDR6940416.1 hypothetical protein [Mucilaginibacter pocheonensis]
MIAFTICSNNYLAHAKTLGDSFLQYHPGSKFIIGLVDKFNAQLDNSLFSDFELIPVDSLNIPEFDSLNLKYNITELNTAVKPSYFHYIFKKYSPQKLLYIDPDILIQSSLTEVSDILESKNIVITPHILSPIDDDYAPTDYHTLRGGVFNLGFIALSNYSKVKDFLDWWHQRVIKYGFSDFGRSMFYDQLWINFVPCFYDNFHILKHPGYNVANWNLHERQLSKSIDQTFMINNEYPLRFFHFSSYNYYKPHIICSYLTRYSFTSRPDLLPLFNLYYSLLKKNNIEVISKSAVYYYPGLNGLTDSKPVAKRSLILKVFSRVKRSVKVLITGHD